MLPQQALSTTPQKAGFLFPDNVVRRTELEDYEMGGLALSDPSEGLLYQAWQGEINATSKIATLTPLDTGSPVDIFTETVTPVEFSFSFDLNMRPFSVTRFADNTAKLRWYDASIPGNTITTYTDILSCMLCLDDKRPVNSGQADVLLTYLKTDNKLYFRAQRERFLIEYLLGDLVAPGLRITNFGMGKNLRVQWRIAVRRLL
jgi:hypothetical protein